MKRFIYNKDGFSLVELLVVILILGLITTAIITFMSGAGRYQKGIELEADYQNVTNALIQRTRVELANAKEVKAVERDTIDYENRQPDDGYSYIVSYGQDTPASLGAAKQEQYKGKLLLYTPKVITAADGTVTYQSQDPVTLAPTSGTFRDDYACYVSFKTSTDHLSIFATIERLDTTTTDASGNTVSTKPYTQSTDIYYEDSLDTSGGYQYAVRFMPIE